MTLRDDLEKVIQMGHDIPSLKSLSDFVEFSTIFLRDHGQALLEAVDRANRYEAVRKMNPPTFTKVVMHNIETGIPFDTLIDTWAFNHGYPSAIDAAMDGER